jgi:hypothetical protein
MRPPDQPLRQHNSSVAARRPARCADDLPRTMASPKPHLGDVGALVAPVQQRLQLLGNPRAGIDTDLRVVVDQAIRPYRQAPPADQHDRRGGGAGVGVSSAIQIYRIGDAGASRRGPTRSRIWKRLTARSFRTQSPEQPEPQNDCFPFGFRESPSADLAALFPRSNGLIVGESVPVEPPSTGPRTTPPTARCSPARTHTKPSTVSGTTSHTNRPKNSPMHRSRISHLAQFEKPYPVGEFID